MGTPNGTVLLVEEDPSLRRTLNYALSDLKFDIGLAGTAAAALTRLRMVDYELVLLDINMRDNDGIETCRRIRRSFTRLPIFILTAREGLDDPR